MASLQKPSSEGSSDSGCGCQENKRLPQALGFGPVSHNPITDRLKHMEMSQLATKNVLTVTTHTSLQEATIKMVENFVSSVPVYDPQENRCIGTVNLLDIATYIARNVAPAVPREDKCHPKVELLKQEPVKNVMNLSGRGPFVLLDIDGGSFPVFDLLSRGLHRVLLQSRSGDVSWNVSQSDLVAKIYQLRYEKDISEMLCSINVSAFYNSKSEQNLISATSDIPVIDAVRLLVEQGVSAVPIVSSKDGTLVGNFSASDIRGLFALPARQWNMPVEQYLYEYSRPSLTPYVVRNDSTNLGAILEYLVNEHLHHLWIVNEHSRPIACVSLTDILRVIRDHKHSASTSTSSYGGAGVKSTSGAAGAGMSQETIEALTR